MAIQDSEVPSAFIYLIAACQRLKFEAFTCLCDVLARVVSTPKKQLDRFLPGGCQPLIRPATTI